MAKVTSICLSLLLLGLLLIGAEAQTQQCSMKLQECMTIVTSVFARSSEWMSSGNKAAMESACNNATLKTCLSQVRTVCGDNAMAASITQSIEPYCSPSGTGSCQQEMLRCMTPITSATSGGSPANPLELCPLYQQASTCLASATQCQSFFNQMNVTQSFSFAFDMCRKASGVCPQAMECLQSNPEFANPSDCSGRAKLIQCMGTKKDVCKFHEGPASFEKVYNAALGLCSDLDKHPKNPPECEAAVACTMSSKVLAPFAAMMSGPPDLGKAVALLGNSTFLCQLVETSASCYVDSAKACHYTPDFVADVTSRHHSIKATCAGQSAARQDAKPTGGMLEHKPTGGSIQWTTSAVFMLLTALCGRLLVF